ncbi:MAG: hypothetical protein IPM42_14060 [Saprospiraceae bacterium]|nr:hypothetical protein [Saprospiraceae bacterium]MBK9256609.1 hypothetical protein [Saprospiraceae bacterium]
MIVVMISDVSKDLIFEKAFELANKTNDKLTESKILKATIFYYYHFCVCLKIDVSVNDKHLQSMYNGELKEEFEIIHQE